MNFKYRDYFDLINPKYIAWEFYEPFTRKEPPFGQLGLVVYLRTHSRFIPELGRREKFCETILRTIEYNINLDIISDYTDKKEEAELLFNRIFNLEAFPSSRSLWIAGTNQTKADGSANWNCTATNIDTLSAFSEVYYWLLLGAGTGLGLQKDSVSKLPRFYTDKEIIHHPYEFNSSRKPETVVISGGEKIELTLEDLRNSDKEYLDSIKGCIHDVVKVLVGDSKEGWCNAARTFLHLCTLPNVTAIQFNYNSIRPEGERIKTFGGRSSGYRGVRNTIDRTFKILRRCHGKVEPIDALDILNGMGVDVASGGVRRTAEIGLGDISDEAFINAKVNLFTDDSLADYRSTRVMSNNSVLLYENPGLERIQDIMTRIRSNGEPGFWIVGNAQKFDSRIKLTNPCGEAALDSKQSCNLTTLNLVNHIQYAPDKGVWELDWEKLKQTIQLVTRVGSRQTLAKQWHPEWDNVQKRDRLLGVSMTGIVDAFDMLDWSEENEIHFWKWAKKVAREAADNYHDFLGIPRSARVTLLKPEGTLSKLPTVSSGIHRSYSPYQFRRIRFSKLDPLSKVLHNLGMQPVPENEQGDDLNAPECNTWIYTFPLKNNTKTRAIDEPAVVQLERYRRAQKYYADGGHNVSITVTLAPREYDTAATWVYENYDDIIGISFLPRFDPREGGVASYANLPEEHCEEWEYEELKAATPNLKEEELISLISLYEHEQEEYTLEGDCVTGACPLR